MSEDENTNEVAPTNSSQEDGGDTNSTCMICQEEWTIASDHRVSCLKCGHLFGKTCIEKWISTQGSTAKCPICNKPARKADVRALWCKTIRAKDNSELIQLQNLLENERKLRKSDSAVIFHQNLKLEMLYGELEKLKKGVIDRDLRIKKLEGVIRKVLAQREAAAGEVEPIEIDGINIDEPEDNSDHVVVEARELKGMFHFAEKVESNPTGGCKAFTICPTASILLVAQPSPQNSRNVFRGHGLRKLSVIDTSIREFIPLHSKEITSIKLKTVGDLILTSSLEKRVKITSISNNTCIQTYTTEHEPACVAWSAHRDQQFYVASANCFVTLYDIRNTQDYIYQVDRRVASTRVLSIAASSGESESLNGLILNDIRGCQFLEVSQNSDYDLETIDRSLTHLTGHQLPFSGVMGTVDFCKRLDLSLVSTRRTAQQPNAAHNLVKLMKVQQEDGSSTVKCKSVRTFVGCGPGELLSQSRILKHPTLNDHVLVGATDQASRGIKLWDSSDNTEFQTIKEPEFVRDMMLYSPENSNQHILYTLSEKGLSVYRWDFA